MILIKFGQYINEMMAVAVKNFQNFLWSRFLIIRQNVNVATNAILNCGLTPLLRNRGPWAGGRGPWAVGGTTVFTLTLVPM